MRSSHSKSKLRSRSLSNSIISLLCFLPFRKARQACHTFVRLKSVEELSVISITYEIYKKLVELNTSVDKKYRHTISEPAIESCQILLKQLILAKLAPKPLKGKYLIEADSSAELLALQLRVILELKLVNETNILKVQAKLTETRRQTGGWRKSLS